MALTQITTDGIKDGTITGTDLATNVDLVDNQKLRLGTGNDLRIFHNGSDSLIQHHNATTNNDLHIQSDTKTIFGSVGGAETHAVFNDDGAVELYYDNTKRFETTSAGVKLLGSGTDAIEMTGDVWFNNNEHAGADIYFNSGNKNLIFEDNVIAKFGGGGDLQIYHDGSDSYINDAGTGNLYITSTDGNINLQTNGSENAVKCIENGSVELYHDGSKKFETYSSGIAITGDIDVNGGGNIFCEDNGKIRLGNSEDLQIYHDGSNSYIKQVSSGTGNLLIFADGHEIQLIPKSGEPGIKVINDAAVELYYNGSKKFETTSLGTQTFGDAQFEGNDGTDNQLKWDKSDDSLYFRDSVKAQFGTGGDLQIFHDGSGNNIINSANNGTLKFQRGGSDVFEIKSTGLQGLDNKKVMLGNNDDLQIYHDGSNTYIKNFTNNLHIGAFSTGGNSGMWFYSGNNDRINLNPDGHFLPVDNNSYDLGSSSQRWRNIYTNDLNLSNEGGANDVDGTYGSYTIQEGHHDLFLINKRTGKKYKFNLTEVS